MVRYIISWVKSSGTDASAVVNDEVFVGRLPLKLLEELGFGREYVVNVFVYDPRRRRPINMEVQDATVSRFHCKLFIEGDKLYIVDHGKDGRGSANGTFVNGRKIPPAQPIRVDVEREPVVVTLGLWTTFRIGVGEEKGVIEVPVDSVVMITKEELDEVLKSRPQTIKTYHRLPNNYVLAVFSDRAVFETKHTIVRSVQQSDVMEAKYSLKTVNETLLKVLLALERGDRDNAMRFLEAFANKDIMDRIRRACTILKASSIAEDLERLIKVYVMSGTPPPIGVLKESLDRLVRQIDLVLETS